MSWRFVLLVLLVLPGTALARNLTQEAVDFSAQDFETRWLHGPSDWWLSYEIPANSQMLPPQPTIRRYVQARDVAPAVNARQLTQADTLNGLQWSGSIRIVAQSAREYDFAKGWQPWQSRPMLVIYQIEKRNDQWKVVSMSTGMMVPSTTRFRKPTPNELPSADAGPRQTTPEPPQETRLPCPPSCRDRYCEALR